MAYISISNWTLNGIDDAQSETLTAKFAPLIMSVGASAVQMVRTGANSLSVVTHYADAETAAAASAKIAAIRAQAADEAPMVMDSVAAGEVIRAM